MRSGLHACRDQEFVPLVCQILRYRSVARSKGYAHGGRGIVHSQKDDDLSSICPSGWQNLLCIHTRGVAVGGSADGVRFTETRRGHVGGEISAAGIRCITGVNARAVVSDLWR